MKLVIVSGLSGAGKSVALRQYEDLGWYCIDNLPLCLVEPLITHALDGAKPRFERMAIGIDARALPEDIAAFPRYLESLRARGINPVVLFLMAEESVLMERYSETRRKHPLSDAEHSLLEAIRLERQVLAPISHAADVTLDTTTLNLHQLRESIHASLPDSNHGLALLFVSFGYKNGLPVGSDFVFDVRCLPNPHWVARLRPMTGLDAPVQNWFCQQQEFSQMLGELHSFLAAWVPRFQAQDRSYLTVAIGCTGGQHRSVFVVEQLAAKFKEAFPQVLVKHRELEAMSAQIPPFAIEAAPCP
jgi:UPF0042 nucleotide-binding protein